jgi:hypothetical protein
MTAQQIIANPFANIGYISPDMEQRIGEHMRAAARREGNTPSVTMGCYRSLADELRRAERARLVMAFLLDGGWKSTREIHNATGMTMNDCRATGTRLRAEGLLDRRNISANGQFEFCLTHTIGAA